LLWNLKKKKRGGQGPIWAVGPLDDDDEWLQLGSCNGTAKEVATDQITLYIVVYTESFLWS
jgi:hypothetical protein